MVAAVASSVGPEAAGADVAPVARGLLVAAAAPRCGAATVAAAAAVADTLAALLAALPPADRPALLQAALAAIPLGDAPASPGLGWRPRAALASALATAASLLPPACVSDTALPAALAASRDRVASVRDAGADATGALLAAAPKGAPAVADTLSALEADAASSSPHARRAAAVRAAGAALAAAAGGGGFLDDRCLDRLASLVTAASDDRDLAVRRAGARVEAAWRSGQREA